MKKYEAPRAQVVRFDNDYVMADNQNKSGSGGCSWTCSVGNHKNGPDYTGGD